MLAIFALALLLALFGNPAAAKVVFCIAVIATILGGSKNKGGE